MDKRTMVCGLDAYHETGAGAEISTLGFVASYNKTCTKYWPATNLLAKAGEELATSFIKRHVRDALEHFKEVNGSYPERVILFRDAI